MNPRDELALELFIGDNWRQPREQSVVDWTWFNKDGRFQGRVEQYNFMADHLMAVGYRKERK